MLALKVENLSKQYRLGQIGTGTLSHDLNRLWARVRGKEDPYAKIGATNDRTQKAASDYVWALKDINFEIEQGDAVGIIGRNGAGKSTLLKILSRTTLPTTGSVKVKGRIASLLEVGTGFHPEMTGRENIYQNGALLGMTRSEIKRKFDEIVDFSGCEAYIDTPVKRYSSGMYVRLAFAVAAHLESEILIVDEVLAVGDAEFQKKCLGKMNDVSKSEGRTVLFVSHNIGAVKSLCNKGVLMENGTLNYFGEINFAIDRYINNRKLEKTNQKVINKNTFKVFNFKMENDKIFIGSDLEFSFSIQNTTNISSIFYFNCEISSLQAVNITCIGNEFNNQKIEILPNETIHISILIKELKYLEFDYQIYLWVNNFIEQSYECIDIWNFTLQNNDFLNSNGKIPSAHNHGVIITTYDNIIKEKSSIRFECR